MFWSLVWLMLMVEYGSTSPYVAIIPIPIPGRGGFRATTEQERSEESGDLVAEQSLRSDCGRLLRLYNRLHSESGAYALLAEGQISRYALDACARFLLSATRALPVTSLTRDYGGPNWTVERARRDYKFGPVVDARMLRRRGYDDYGKRLAEAANKSKLTQYAIRIQASSSKNANKNSGTHEYIRFGKK